MKIRIERLEIELPDLIENYFERERDENEAFEGNKRLAITSLLEIAAKLFSTLMPHSHGEPPPAEPPFDSSGDDPKETP